MYELFRYNKNQVGLLSYDENNAYLYFNCQNYPVKFLNYHAEKFLVVDNYIVTSKHILDLRKVSKTYVFDVRETGELIYKNISITLEKIKSFAEPEFIDLTNVSCKFGKNFIILNYPERFSVINYNFETLLSLPGNALIYDNLVLCNGKLLDPETGKVIKEDKKLLKVKDSIDTSILLDDKIYSLTDQNYFLTGKELSQYCLPGADYFSVKNLKNKKTYLLGFWYDKNISLNKYFTEKNFLILTDERFNFSDSNLNMIKLNNYRNLNKILEKYFSTHPFAESNMDDNMLTDYILNLIEYLNTINFRNSKKNKEIVGVVNDFKNKYFKELLDIINIWNRHEDRINNNWKYFDFKYLFIQNLFNTINLIYNFKENQVKSKNIVFVTDPLNFYVIRKYLKSRILIVSYLLENLYLNKKISKY